MVSGTRYLSSFPLLHQLSADNFYFSGSDELRGKNLLDGGAPFYNVYTCKDGKWISVGCLEPQFFEIFLNNFIPNLSGDFLDRYGSRRPTVASQLDRDSWPRLRSFLTEGFQERTRDEWAKIFHGL